MSDNYLGEIRLFAGSYAPVGWAFCDASVLPISQNEALFSLIGTTYGGDGITTFALPDLRGRVAVGTGAGNNLTPRTLGQIVGTEQVAMTAANTPAHSHGFSVTNAPATTAEPAGPSAHNTCTFAAFTPAGPVKGLYSTANTDTAVTLNNGALVRSGGIGSPHDNMMGSRAINYIIALTGIYPSQF
ncbi:hypothetical protein C4Q28_13580 [Pseudomonas sp. SWI6]|uniref:Phage tail protein n=1 Tax=Pseudomonas taiwanensis TaxID=470150 RepID=A0ABR6V5Z8_9PSED|nr:MULTISPECIES: tail fiber protein [Pseudomonas]AGZ35421.1 hypothetical protein PVLB_13175 [Pseudomonas sp. VLB120]AVD83122.1 hypothetical protein C4Q28_13580 [Pseudomonas sp. SWI6]AVD90282.1 hypothetical protein C4Q26_25405 [Pseudomonas sp. SWI44]MBC3475851.1 phage tail protein [Pseudomonas taiwanensis]MBC3489336.1 phage tail protein [Pseudomonas taiwanensis]